MSHLGEFFGAANVAVSSVTASLTSVQILPRSDGRRHAYFYNHSSGALFLKMGDGGDATSFSVKLMSGSFYEMIHPIHTGSITGAWDSAAGSVMITEHTAVDR